MSEYSVDVGRLLASSKHIADATNSSHNLPTDFEAGCKKYDGWAGDEGGDDPFANKVGPQERLENEQILQTVTALTQAFVGLVGAIQEQAAHVQKPQGDALDSIREQANVDPGNVRR